MPQETLNVNGPQTDRVTVAFNAQTATVRNLGPDLVYYGDRNVTSTSNTGSVAAGATATVPQGTFFVTTTTGRAKIVVEWGGAPAFAKGSETTPGPAEREGLASERSALDAASVSGVRFFETDTLRTYRSDGTQWQQIGGLSGVELGYAEITANVTGIQTVQDITGLTVTVTVGSRPIAIHASFAGQKVTNAGLSVIAINEGATQLTQRNVNLAASEQDSFDAWVRLAPSAGSHTYKVRASSSTATLSILAGSTFPAFIRVVEL